MRAAQWMAGLRALIVAVLAGAGAGLIAVLTYQAMLALQALVWNTGAEHGEVGPVRIALTILAGGAMLILLGRLARSESVDELIADAGAAQPGHARRILVTALAAIVAIAFGGAVGPEAGLLAVVAQCSILVTRVIARNEARAREISRAGVAGALSGFYGSPPAAAAIDDGELSAGKLTSFIAGLSGFFVFFAMSRTVFDGSGLSDIPLPTSTEGNDWLLVVPALIGCGFGLAFKALHHAGEVAAARIGSPWLVTAIGTALFAALAAAIPLVRFSGHHELNELPELFADGDAALLWLVAAAKIIAVVLCLSSGWRGGEAFPLIYVGGLVGAATALALPGLDPAAAIVAAMGATLSVGWKRPLVALLILILILDTGFALPLLIGVGLGAVVHKASTAAPAETSAPAEASAPRTATTEGSNG